LAAGTYSVTIADADHCSGVANVTIGEPPPLSGFVLSNTAVPCEEEETGAAVVNGSGGTAPYIYTWPGGATGPAQTGLAKGTYPVLLADANGCTHIVHLEISVADLLPPVVSVQNLILELDENGTANLTPADLDNGSYDHCGIAAFHISKSHFTCDDLGDHLVTLTVTDVNGNENSAVANVTVTDHTPPVLLCPEAIFSNHCGLPLSYDLPVAEGNCLTGPPVLVQGLPPGAVFPLGETLVTYEVSSAAGNQAVCSFTVTLENTLAGSMEISPPSCAGSTDGSATVLPVGGAGDFTYQWSVGGQTSPTLSGLGAGIYQVTVTDGAGCAFEAEAFVQGPPLLLLFIENTESESAPGTADGAISILVSGGVPPYHFEWTNNGQVVSTAEDPDNLAAGQYNVLVTDAYGCQLLSSPILVETLTGTSLVERWGRFVELYPNPTRGPVFVEFMLDEIPQAALVLHDMAGRAVWEKSLAGNQHTLDFTGLPAGVYQLKIIAGERAAVKKVVVVR